MQKINVFFKCLLKKINDNELFLISNALTYKLLISIFPFIIFIMTLFGFFNINVDEYIQNMNNNLPTKVYEILNIFLKEVIYTKNISLLSSSFLISIYSSSTGFTSVIRGLNKVYEIKETRSIFKIKIISILLVFLFAFLVNSSLILFIFSDKIKFFILKYFSKYSFFKFIIHLFESIFFNIFSSIIILIMIIIIYKIAINKSLKIINILPGAIFTVSGWLIFSRLFNFYVNNFSKYSKIYASIGGIFVLVIWLNLLSFLLLLGGQINALMEWLI